MFNSRRTRRSQLIPGRTRTRASLRGKLPSRQNSEKDKKPPPPPLSETHMCRLSHKPRDGLHLFSVCHFTINDADSRLITPRPRGPSAASEPPSHRPHINSPASYGGGRKSQNSHFNFHFILFCCHNGGVTGLCHFPRCELPINFRSC